ncbi:CitMHS family transporter [Pseudomonas petrae]|uniref:Citrate:proton symporter n=1 Tax=Pseudomonas petrae TaxID=2912190 RepID=A0ABS9I4W7_9PSED|nr:citrate:proton symporter [Pseudomonas petrae]MCF7532306.1 citrate:proton symporter [Pseudomonas petrae]MCF7535938.1 citrate:proton symporter [Pseudomonas petrae]MCF7542799.1 citrate:proton symporter [Pseudomonas petrae]MCF7555002.1 citrate:proton symporter [Pseudomonas petrae]
MLIFLSYAMIASFMYLIMSKRLSPLVALLLVPVVFGCLSGFTTQLGAMMYDGIKMLAPTGIMLTFAILYFCMMTDAGLFNPLIKVLLRLVKGDPRKIVVGTAVLGLCVGLDGDGATTYIIATAAFLPLYRLTGIRLQVMATVLLMAIGVMNILPWAGPFSRAASAMHVDITELFLEMVPVMIAGGVWVIFAAWWLGRMEYRRLGLVSVREDEVLKGYAHIRMSDPKFLFNVVLTVALISCMMLNLMPLPILFMVAFGLACLVNFPTLKQQKEVIARHADNVMAVTLLIFAAGIFVGIMGGTGMIKAISDNLITLLPQQAGHYMSVITALLSMPFTYVLTNDAFYFGVLPILAETAAHYGIGPHEMAIASLIGQPVHLLSPLVASTYLLCGLLDIDYGDNQRVSLKWTFGTVVVMLFAAIAIGAITIVN